MSSFRGRRRLYGGPQFGIRIIEAALMETPSSKISPLGLAYRSIPLAAEQLIY